MRPKRLSSAEIINNFWAGTLIGLLICVVVILGALFLVGCEGGNPFSNEGLRRTETRLTTLIDDATWEIGEQITRVNDLETQIQNLPEIDETRLAEIEEKLEALPADDALRAELSIELAKLRSDSDLREIAKTEIERNRTGIADLERKVEIWETEREVTRAAIKTGGSDPLDAAGDVATAVAPFLPPPWNALLTTVLGVGSVVASGIAKHKSGQFKKLVGNIEGARDAESEGADPDFFVLDREKFIKRNDRTGISARIDAITG